MLKPVDRERISVAVLYAGLAVLAYLLFLVVRPFLVPLGWAAVMAIVFHPVHARFVRRWGSGRAALASTLAVGFIVIVPLALVMTIFVREALQAAGDVQQAFGSGQLAWVDRAWAQVQRFAPAAKQVDVASLVVGATRQLALFIAAQAGALLQNVAVFVADVVIALFAVFFLFRDAAAIMQAVRRALPWDDTFRDRMIRQIGDLVSASVTAAVIVASLQGLLGGVLFAVLGIAAPVFWGVVMAFFCLLPFGAWVVWLPAGLLLMAGGSFWRGLILIGVGAGIVSAVDNVLRPILLSGRTQMNGLLILISLLGGIAAFGSLGLVLGPIVVAVAQGLLAASTASASKR